MNAIARKALAALLALMLCASLCMAALADGQPGDDPLPLAGVVIGIDPGHQKYGDYRREKVSPKSSKKKYRMSAGTSGVKTGVKEHVQNLRIGLKLRDAFAELGAEVHMTRTKAKVNISNKQRAKMMNAAHCDLVLRLHCNAANRGARGIVLYTSPVGKAGKLSRRAGKQLLKHMKKGLKPKSSRLASTKRYTGLNWSTVPSVLIEMGFMSNPEEDVLLNKPSYQKKLVNSMVAGARAYLGR